MTFKITGTNAEEIAEQIGNVDAGQVSAALDALKALEPVALRNEVADILEKSLIEVAGQATASILEGFPGGTVEQAYQAGKELHEQLQGLDLSDFGDTDLEEAFKAAAQPQTAEEQASTQALAKAFNTVAAIKGDAAQPVTKAVVKEIAALDGGANHGDSFRLITTVAKGYEKATKKGPTL